MLSKDELVKSADNVFLVLGVVFVKMLNQFGLYQPLLVQSFLVFENLEGYVLLLFMVIGPHDHPEAALAQFLVDFVPVAYMLVESVYVFVVWIIEAMISLFVDHPHFRQTSARLGVQTSAGHLLALFDWEKVNCLEFKKLTFFVVP